MGYTSILVEQQNGVGLIRLNRPKVMNALSTHLITELGQALEVFEADDATGAIVITGSDKAFAAGADVKELQDKNSTEMLLQDFPFMRRDGWDSLNTLRKPVIAAVSGVALGGGCELAMACDFILASDTARFGQPEIMLGTMPGAGGTQRLVRAVGKAKAMEMCLTGRLMEADEAERAGLVSRIIPGERLLKETLDTAAAIATQSRPSVYLVKEAVNAAFETSLQEGMHLERRAFAATFATEDCREGMQAFLEKRKPEFKHK